MCRMVRIMPLLLKLGVYILSGLTSSVSPKYSADSLLLRVSWPGSALTPEDLLSRYEQHNLRLDDVDAVLVSTVDNEKYVCSLPMILSAEDEKASIASYTGLSPKQLLLDLYEQKSCTYRIEMYWTYELCHGRYVRQYHEEKELNQKVLLQEYYLGQYIADAADPEETFDLLNPPTRKIEDKYLPYYSVKYVQGTLCDITNKPRAIEVIYVCFPDARNQIYQFDEVASCEYELVVLTSSICSHPSFRPDQKTENLVNCYPVDSSPPKPTALTIWEREQKWNLNQQSGKSLILGPGGDAFPHRSQQPLSREDIRASATLTTHAHRVSPEPPPSIPSDDSLIRSFLSGQYCLYGGSGWWKHEYCHGKQVIQFHEDQTTGQREDVLLGRWIEREHLDWIEERPHKRPKQRGRIQQVAHFYSYGDICDITGLPRTVEVRLRCPQGSVNPNAVTLYLLEPKTCEYVMGIESQMLCDMLQTVDENGLFIASQPEH